MALAQQIADAKVDSDAKLGTARYEAQTRREKLEKLEKEDNERKKKGMDELTLAKTELGEFQTNYASEKKRADGLEAELAFFKAGVADSETALLYWEKLTPEERAATNPAEFAKTMAAKKPTVFGPAQQQDQQSTSGFGGNHRQDEGGNQQQGGPVINRNPQTQAEINSVFDAFDRTFHN